MEKREEHSDTTVIILLPVIIFITKLTCLYANDSTESCQGDGERTAEIEPQMIYVLEANTNTNTKK